MALVVVPRATLRVSLLAGLVNVLALAPLAAGLQSWVDRSPPTFSPTSRTHGLAISPLDSEHLVCSNGYGANARVWESLDRGASWVELTLPATAHHSPRATIGPDGDVYLWVSSLAAPTPTTEFLYRRNAAGGWHSIGPSFTEDNPFGFHILTEQFAVSSANGERLALWLSYTDDPTYGAPSFLYLSSDGGATWSAPDLSMENALDLTIIEGPQGPRLLKKGGQIPSTGQEEWYRESSGWNFQWTGVMPFTMPEFATSLERSRLGGERLLYSAYVTALYPWGLTTLQESLDGGATWAPLGPLGHFSHLQVGSLRSDLVVRHTEPGIANGSTVELSLDGARTWSSLPAVPGVGAFRPQLMLSPDDAQLYAFGSGVGIKALSLFGEPGVSECSAEINGSGSRARTAAIGSASLAANDLVLWARDVTANQFGFFITSETPGFVASPGGSFGSLCLGGTIGRYSKAITNSGPTGELTAAVDWTAMPSPTLPQGYAAQVGETWRFQAWFRDSMGGQGGSNFSDAVRVRLQP